MNTISEFIHCDKKYKNNFTQISGKDENLAFSIKGTKLESQKMVYKAVGKYFSDEDVRKVKDGYRRSVMDTEALYEDIHRMALEPWDIIEDEHFELALDVVEGRVFKGKEGKFLPIHVCELRHYPWKFNKSACQPYLDDKELTQRVRKAHAEGKLRNPLISYGNLKNHIFKDCRMKIHTIKDSPYPKTRNEEILLYDVDAFARSHLVAEDDPDKIRFVYGCPKLGILTECMFTWPFHAHCKTQGEDGIMAWGYETLKGGLFRLCGDSTGRKPKWNGYLQADWKQFDKRYHFRLMERIFERWENHIDFRNGYEPSWEYPNTKPSDPDLQERRLKRLFYWMTNSIMKSPIRGPEGDRFLRNFAGMPSGIFNTNYLDCWGNAIIMLSCLSSLGFNISDRRLVDIKVMGDDSYIKIGTDPDTLAAINFLPRLQEEAARRYNFVLSIAKSNITATPEGGVFLGYSPRSGFPKRDTFQLLGMLAHPERTIRLDTLAARAVGFAWASCMYDERVYNVCKDVYDYITIQLKIEPNYPRMRFLEFTGLDADVIDFGKFPTPEEIRAHLIPTHPMEKSCFAGLPPKVFIQDPTRVPRVLEYFKRKSEELKIPLDHLTSLHTYEG
uniref:RdRp n=1 Tax=viral metagenome TaxID=1070528 RepID=A0A8J9RQ42_9ZZZZ